MLSAVAARKARLQSKERSSTPSAPTPQRPPSPQPVQKVTQYAKPPSKRKPSSEAAKPLSNKRRKVNKPQEKPARYFQRADAFKEQEDVIVVEDDEEEVESGQTSGDEQTVKAASAKSKRAWSPSAPFQDSSDDEDAEDNAETPPDLEEPELLQPARTPAETPSVLSTYRPIPDQNIFDVGEERESFGLSSTSSAKLLCLIGSERLALLGTYTLRVLYGSITLSGVTLTPSNTAHRVFAPRSAPLPIIECLPLTNRPPNHPDSLPQQLQRLAKSADAVIVLQELNTGVEGLGRVCRTFENVFEPSRWQKNQGEIDLGLPAVHCIAYETHESLAFVLSPSWSSAIASVLPLVNGVQIDFSRQVYLVRGAKKSGKSTFAKTLLNNLTTRYRKVAFLECDLGQSEFTPGGMVALNIVSTPLFGPPFTHPSIPHQAHYIGSTSPRNCPSYYVETIATLVQTYNLDIQSAPSEPADMSDPRIADIIPLVVNMMGWTKGLGADLSRRIEEIVEPSAIFELEASTSEEGWPMYQTHAGDLPPRISEAKVDAAAVRTYRLEPISPAIMSTRFSPADHRTLSILSYFHAVFPVASVSHSDLRSEYATSWNTALPLCAQVPFKLAARDALDDVILIGPGSEDVVSPEIGRVLNGAVVAMVSCEPGAVDHITDGTGGPTISGIPYIPGVTPPPPSTSICHGLALVRSVGYDTSSAMPSTFLHVLTPLPPSVLSDVKPRVLIKGEIELPVWGMLDFRSEDSIAGIEMGKVPYLQWGKGEGVGGERRRIRRNLMRRGQM